MFLVLEKIEEKENSKPFFVDYVITAKGWRASGGIKCGHSEDKTFWSMLEMVVKNILKGNHDTVLNESYTDGFSRYLRPVKRNDFTLRWEEINYDSSNQTKIEEAE